MTTRAIPCVLMCGGTSRGPYFLASDLPADPRERDRVLIQVMGSGHELEIDGIGGGHPLTSKVAIVSPSKVKGADVDYLFAQVDVCERRVDTSPNCGNMLAGVGPFALEAGLVPIDESISTVRIYNVNTKKLIEARIQTPGGKVKYDGTAAIDGVPGTAAPIHLAFLDAAGSKTGKLFPTGNPRDLIDGVEVSCIDAAMPIMALNAKDLGKTGYERPAEFATDHDFMKRLESLRLEAGKRMGLGDVKALVIPKPVLVAQARRGGTLTGRYFMPHACHNAFATTGAVAVGTAAVTAGNVISETAGTPKLPADIVIEHPSGTMQVHLEERAGEKAPVAYIVRTARRLFEGKVLVDV
ncbi:MAG TPA: 4-oxalomesaconate tautomerase [Micropepsaceae bacterium]|nr:4-oxalomesaconate tautomerase [Micropepsaceae bacterium]